MISKTIFPIDKTVLIAIALAALLCIIECSVDAILFHEGSLAEQMSDPRELWPHLLVFGILVIFGVYVRFAITRRKRAEEKAQQQSEFLQTTLESLPHPFYVVDANDYTIELANSATSEGALPESSTCHAFIHKRGHPCGGEDHPCPLEQVKRTRKPVTLEHTHYDKDGNARIVEVHACPIFDTEGNVAQIIEYCLDITERQMAEKALRESGEKFRRLLGDINDGYCVIQDERVVVANEKYAEITGIPFDQVIGYPLGASLPVDARERLRERHRRRMSGEAEAERYEGVNETGRWVEINTKLINYEGRPAVAAVVRDITERKRMEEALRESESRYRLLAENISDVIWTMDTNLRYAYVSPSVTHMRGYSVDEFLAQSVRESLTPASLEIVRKAMAEIMAMPNVRDLGPYSSKTLELELNCKDGSTVWADTSMTALRDEEGRPIGILGITRDITERKRAEEALRESEKLYSTMAYSSQVGVYIVQDGKFVFVNPQLQEDTGYAENELLGTDPLQLVHPEDREMVRNNAVTMLKDERSLAYEYRIIGRDGETKWIMETVASIQYQGRRATLGNFMDITQRKQIEEAIRHVAFHDTLTGLPNRMLFDDRLNVEIAHARRNGQKLALMFLDLDRFKAINDTFGHKAGDQTLQAVGQRLSSLLRKSDTVARMGGDEFTLILPEIARPNDADKVAQKILEALREPFILDGLEVRITTSVGTAVYPDDGEDADTIMKNADTAMYRAKERGRDNYLRYTPAMNAEAHCREHLKPSPVGGAQGES